MICSGGGESSRFVKFIETEPLVPWPERRPAPHRARIIESDRYYMPMRPTDKRRIIANPGMGNFALRAYLVLLLSWLVTTWFCHFVLFTVQKARRRSRM